MTLKAYVKSWKEQPVESHTKVSVQFDNGQEKAALWETREQAQNACREFESLGVTISSRGGQPCKSFAVEERAPKEFVVFCEYPAETVA